MTIQEYFTKRTAIIGINGVSTSFISDYIKVKGISPETEEEDPTKFDEIFLDLVLTLLLRPNISEGDLSISYDKDAILKWYSIECSRLGIDDLYRKSTNEVRDMSSLA